jgi:parvulin-like peptidyl-prolyl isomerase
MKRTVALLVLSVFAGSSAAGCQRSTQSSSNPPAGSSTTEAADQPGQKPGAPAPGTQAPAAALPSGSGASTPAGQTVEAPVKPVPAVLPAVLATVNGENVDRWELEAALSQAETSAGGPVLADQRDSVLRRILDELLMYHMLAQEARARNMIVSEAEFDAEMAAIRQSFPDEEAFKQALLLQGLPLERLREVTRRSMAARKVIDAEVTSKVAVQDADVDAYYKGNPQLFKQGETVRVSHIYFAVPPNSPQTVKNQARAAAEDTLKQLKAGGDFAKLAKERSNDPSAENGGELPFFQRGDLPPDFEEVAFALRLGATSEIAELATGLHIVKLHERRGPRTAPLEEVREGLREFLIREQRQTRLDQLMEQIKAKARIQILV